MVALPLILDLFFGFGNIQSWVHVSFVEAVASSSWGLAFLSQLKNLILVWDRVFG